MMVIKDIQQRSRLVGFAHAQRARWSLTQDHRLFWRITLHSEP